MRHLRTFVAVVTTTAGLTALPAAAQATTTTHAPRLLSPATVQVGSKTAPLTVRIRTDRSATLTVRVNGVSAGGAFHRGRATERIGELAARNGLRRGTNRITIRATMLDGRYDTTTRTVSLRRAPLSDAGPDRGTYAKRSVTVGLRPSRHAGGLRGSVLRWRIASAPKGTKPKLRSPSGTTATLHAAQAGTYVLRLTAADGSTRSHDTTVVHVRPNDPAAGVSIETQSDRADGTIRVDGRALANTYHRPEGDGIAWAVLERATRFVMDSGTVPRAHSGIVDLHAIADRYSTGDKYLMVVSERPNPIPGAELDGLANLMRKLGHTLTAPERDSIATRDAPFSIIGIPGVAAEDSAWTSIPTMAGGDRDADITGLLQVNTNDDEYGYVAPEHPTFDTQVGGPQEGRNTIRFNGRDYTLPLPGGAKNGFQVLLIDTKTLEVKGHNTVADVDPQAKTPADRQAPVVKMLREYRDRSPNLLMIVQSIGRPKGQTSAWNDAAVAIEQAGGTRTVFDALDGTHDYALVGGTNVGPAAVEASDVFGQPARLQGFLARGHDMKFTPVAGGPAGGVNTEMTEIAYQKPEAFPAFTTGEKAAERWIGDQVNLCTEPGQPCDFRLQYFQNFEAGWTQIASRMAQLEFPGTGRGFTEADLKAVRKQLSDEIFDVDSIKAYFAALQKPFLQGSDAGRIDLESLGDEMYNLVGPQDPNNKASFVLGLIGKVSAVGGFLKPPASSAAAGIAAAFGLVSYLTHDDGSPQLGVELKVKAGALARTIRSRLFDTAGSMTGIALLLVGDYGKLQAAARKLNTPTWKLPSNSRPTLDAIGRSAQQWFAEQLTPVAYPWLLRGTPQPLGPPVARAITCYSAILSGRTTQPWRAYPNSAEFRPVDAWTADDTPVLPTYFFSRAGIDAVNLSPSPKIVERLFGDPAAGGLGISKYRFLSPRVFGELRHALDQNDPAVEAQCGLPL